MCAPSPDQVNDMITSCNLDPSIGVYPFEPENLMEVIQSFEEVGNVCGVPERGIVFKREFEDKVQKLIQAVTVTSNSNSSSSSSSNSNIDLQQQQQQQRKKPKVLLLEWMSPPYDPGHWIPDLINSINCENVQIGPKCTKSKPISWEQIYEADPDMILVACCGFDVERNAKDAYLAAEQLKPLRAARENKVFACNGDMNFARPGPNVLGGMMVVAQCAFADDANVMNQLDLLDQEFRKTRRWEDEYSMEYERIDLTKRQRNHAVGMDADGEGDADVDARRVDEKHCEIEDIEDIYTIHKAACDMQEMSYKDPDTGYQVFTELAHKKRGKCCGSGCRHCPYNHENVKDEYKAGKIQQPAFLFKGGEVRVEPEKELLGSESCCISSLVSLDEAIRTKARILVLFFSGGKDSFLAIRATIRNYRHHASQTGISFCLVLLTTFDSTSRIIAHQEIDIRTVLKQATHLNLPLIGVPMHRGTSMSSDTYLDRTTKALDLLVRRLPYLNHRRDITALIFGDLHLEHIRGWRDAELGKLGIKLEYPLWKVPYDFLYADLRKAAIEITVSSSTKDFVVTGEVYNEGLMERANQVGADAFGENGEFHTIVKVWTSSRECALGLVVRDE